MNITEEGINLLSKLIEKKSVSREESDTAEILENWLDLHGIKTKRVKNNVIAFGEFFDPSKPTLLLNSHHDTVKPSPAYTRDPFVPSIEDDKLYGLGSNDAGASLVGLALAFLENYRKEHKFNLVLALTAEEEVGGENGIRHIITLLKEWTGGIDMAIVGEPTGLQPAIAERGLIVLDCVAHGKSGHAARNEGINALYIAHDDIAKLRNFSFPKKSETLGDIKITVTQIEAGRQHNVIPEECKFVVDVRTTDAYSNEETAHMIGEALQSECRPRSTRVRASVLDSDHPLVKVAVALGGKPFVSPTTSDMSLLHDIPSLKIGPGESSRSHTADEFIYLSELEAGIKYYNLFLNTLDEIME